jgi:acetyltransferase-like isoleucine patch superfamily enzyme
MALPLQLTLFELRTLLGGELEVWGNPPAPTLSRLVPYETAEWATLVVLPERATPTKISRCRAGVVVGSPLQIQDWQRSRRQLDEPGWFLRVEDTGKALVRLLEGPCRPPESDADWLTSEEIVERWGAQARTATVHRSAKIGDGVWVGPGSVVHPRVTVGAGSRIGDGVVLGAPGFGFVGIEGRATPLPHWAGVVIESDVWIGPHSQISAGLLEATWIGSGVRIDSLVQIGHNCKVGSGSILAGQVGLAGSVVLGRGCLVGGQSGFADHIVLGDNCQVAARAGVTKSWPSGSRIAGFPAVNIRDWRRQVVS